MPKTSIKVGEANIILHRINVSAGSNEDVALNQIVFTNTGTISGSDIANLRLRKVNETTSLATGSLLNNKVTFNLASPISLTKGFSVNLELVADIAGDANSAGRTIKILVDEGGVSAQGDVSDEDFVSTGSTVGDTLTIGLETITVSMAASHPQDSNALIIKTTNKKDLAKFDVRANGGDVILNTIKVKFVDSTAALSSTNYLSSVGLYDGDALVSDLKDVIAQTDQTFSLNWTVPANTTRTLSVKGITNTLTVAGASDTVTTTWSEYSGFGLSSGATVSSLSDVATTAITVYPSGTTTLSADSVKTPYSQGILAPVNNVTLGALKVYAQRENLKLNGMTVRIAASTYADNSVSSVTLYADDGVTQLSNPISVTGTGTANEETFAFTSSDYLSDVIFTKDQYKTVLVKGNVSSTGNGQTGITVNIPTSTLTFTGQDSGQSHTGAATNLYITSPYAGGTYKFDKTLVEMKKSADSPSGSVARGSYVAYASWDVTNNSSDLAAAKISKIKLTSKSGLPSSLDDAADETLFKVYDEAGDVIFAGDATKDALAKASGTISFNGGTADYARFLTVNAGEPKKLVLRIDTTSTAKWPSSQQMQWSLELVGDATVETGTPNGSAEGYVGYGGSTWTIPAVANTVTLP